jgi:hypothetical protein
MCFVLVAIRSGILQLSEEKDRQTRSNAIFAEYEFIDAILMTDL